MLGIGGERTSSDSLHSQLRVLSSRCRHSWQDGEVRLDQSHHLRPVMPCRHALSSAKRSDVSKATDTMAESSLIEALAPDVSPLHLCL